MATGGRTFPVGRSARAAALVSCLSLLVARSAAADPIVRMPRGIAVASGGETVWIATEDGLWAHDAKTEGFSRFGTREGLPSDAVNAVVLDSRREPCVGTDSGVAWREGSNWRVVATGLPSPVVLSVLRSRAGVLYAGTDRGIAALDEKKLVFSPLHDSHEFCRDPVLAMDEDAAGVWFARERAFERLRPRGEFEIFQLDFWNPDRACPLLGRFPRTVAVSPSGSVWMPTEGGINILHPPRSGEKAGARWEQIPFLTGPINPSRLPSFEVRAIAFAADGAAWLAFGDAGLSSGGHGVVRRGPDGETKRFGAAEGLPSGRVHALAVAGDGSTVWAATPLGLGCWRDGAWRPIVWP